MSTLCLTRWSKIASAISVTMFRWWLIWVSERAVGGESSVAAPPKGERLYLLSQADFFVGGHRSNCHHRASWHKTKRPGLGLSHKALSRSALPQVLLNYRVVPSQLVVNDTSVLDGITFRSSSRCHRRLDLGVCHR
jgi:hypothetical protein